MSKPLRSSSATVLGMPRIGPNRELERAVEAHWVGRVDAQALHRTAKDLRAAARLQAGHAAGLDSVPVGAFSCCDHVLDTAAPLGALPERMAGIEDDLDRYFAAAHGHDRTAGDEPLVRPVVDDPPHRGGGGFAARSGRRGALRMLTIV